MNNMISDQFGSKSERDTVICEKFREKLAVEKGVDYIIPDYVSDVETILICTAVPKIDGKFINGNYVEIEGTLNISLLLATENNTLSSLSFSEPFDCKVAVENLSDNCSVYAVPTTEYVNARLVNPRKVNVRCQVNCDTKVYCPVKLVPETMGTQSVEDEMKLQRKYIAFRSSYPVSYEEKDINASQDIELDSNLPQIKQIIHCKVRVTPNDIKINDGEAVIRSEAVIDCIYETPDNNYRVVEKKINLEKTMSGITPCDCQWFARAFADNIKTNAASNSYGEMKILELDFTYGLELYGMADVEASAVSDIYSTEFESVSGNANVDVPVFQRTYATNVSVNSYVSRDDAEANNVKNIFTGNVEVKTIGVTFDPEKKRIITEGTASVSLICENDVIIENERLFGLHKYDFPFKCELDASDDHTSSEFVAEYYVSDTKYRADSGNLYADFEMNIKVSALEKNRVEYIETVKIDKNAPLPKSNSKMTLCYPNVNEELWDIAKNYKITRESISEANGLTDENISGKRVLIIPRAR